MPTRVPVETGIFTWPADEPQLIGSRCTELRQPHVPGAVRLPEVHGQRHRDGRARPPRHAVDLDGAGLPAEVAAVRGDADPATFEPFGVGYVELPGEVKVEARLTEADPAKLKIGMEMELVLVPLTTDDDGNEVVTFAFQPCRERCSRRREKGR